MIVQTSFYVADYEGEPEMTITTTGETLTRTDQGVEIPAPGTFVLDQSHSEVGFVTRHMMVAKVRGSFGEFDGTITVAEDPSESSVEASIKVGSIDTRESRRDAHLRSADFFDAEQYPVATFKSTKVSPDGPGTWRVEGELTIREVTRPVVLDVEFNGVVQDPYGGQRIGFSATAEINREDFGMTYNALLESGGVVVSKTARIEIDGEAVRAA